MVRWVALLGCVFLLSAAVSSGRLLQLWCVGLLQLLCLCLGLCLGLGLGVSVSVLGSYVRLCRIFVLGGGCDSGLLVLLQAHVSRCECVSGSAEVPVAAQTEIL